MIDRSSSDLTLRVSRHAANDELQRLYASFEAVAKEMNVHLEVGVEWFFYSGGHGDGQYHGGASQLSS